ncbi:MAG: class I SAM-dependent methyltransferase [Actinomycetota bacterium]
MAPADARAPFDYDSDPERFLLAARLAERTASTDLYAHIAERLTGLAPVLDLGCGPGALGGALPLAATALVGLDRSPEMLRRNPLPMRVRGDATGLPFSSDVFGAVVSINVLYHLSNPRPAIAEAQRVLRPGGLFAAATTSRHDSPELAGVWQPEPSTFDSEDAPALVADVFGDVEVDAWDAPLVRLPDRATVADYLMARFFPRKEAESAAQRVEVPIEITKRGAVVYARR